MKKILWLFVSVLLLTGSVSARVVYDDNYAENPDYLKGMEYMAGSQYSSAINEFKKALRADPGNESALIGLSNAYNSRAKYYNNDVYEPLKAISDIKSALFFNKYFRQDSSASFSQAVSQMEKNLRTLENSQKLTLSPSETAKAAKFSRTKGEFAAAGYDYYRLFNGAAPEYKAEAACALGDIYKIFNRADKASFFYKKAAELDSDNAEIHLKLARVFEDEGDFNASLKEYSYALKKSEEQEDILGALERIWQKKSDENPNDAEAKANLGVVYQKQKRYNEALAEYQKAERLNPQNLNTKINIGTLFQEQKKYDAALAAYNSVLASNPKNINVLLYKAECLKGLNKNDEAAGIYKKVLEIEPENPQAKTELYSLMKSSMSGEELLSYMYQNLLSNPKSAAAYYEFAYELHKAGKIDDAAKYYRQALIMDKNNIDAYINLSQCLRQQKKYEEAKGILKQAQINAPDNKLVKTQLEAVENDYNSSLYSEAANAFEAGNYESAAAIYLRIKPQSAASASGIAASYQMLGNSAAAIEYYKKAMAMDSDNADIPYAAAAIYADLGDMEKAEEYNNLALSKNKMHSQAKELSAYIASKRIENLLEDAVKLYEDEKYTEAAEMFDRIIKINPNEASVYYYRGLTYDALKNYQKAIADYKSAVKLSPEMNIAYYLIAAAYDNSGNYKAAKEFYQKYVNSIADDNEYKQYSITRIKELSK